MTEKKIEYRHYRPEISAPHCHTHGTHYISGWGEHPFCLCGEVRNQAFHRTLFQRIFGLPRRKR